MSGAVASGDIVVACSAFGGTIAHVLQIGDDVEGRPFVIARCDCGCGHHFFALVEHLLPMPRGAAPIRLVREWGRA